MEIPSGTTLEQLKDQLFSELLFPKTSQHLYHNGILLSDEAKTVEQLQIADGDMLALHIRDTVGETGVPAPSQAQAAASRQGQQDTETLRLRILGNPQTRAELERQNPALAAALDNPARFGEEYAKLTNSEAMERQRRRQQINDLNNDPFDVEAQAKIEEMIREERVQENLQNALEHNPEGKLLYSLFALTIRICLDSQDCA